MGVLKKTIGISSKKSLKVFRPRRSLGRLVQGGALDARKKTRGSDQPWPPAPYKAKDTVVIEGAIVIYWRKKSHEKKGNAKAIRQQAH